MEVPGWRRFVPTERRLNGNTGGESGGENAIDPSGCVTRHTAQRRGGSAISALAAAALFRAAARIREVSGRMNKRGLETQPGMQLMPAISPQSIGRRCFGNFSARASSCSLPQTAAASNGGRF